ncbi:helix-turn-helix transcriptional regulator [Gordonibacter massiliensis (ex Traore et al. 2017)]|uniref:Helix-turn-helix transcriptional regulator n=1 Tax=Gordonibacter massiliensis (ex Traore et al. 2017) TaxID=1841863 RepID=A0A842JH88_9ACTN|nr:helix-turn-helix transcriptional regulator [Gordonibacter massiliensis (ex Traore et al. 2017)]MBC2888430.1 helix-turn-helix transcriptional regulator [Gordonibacter massiliensis (ex Traore et al. 2017)]
MELGVRIKQHRTARGLSQEDLAGKIYVSRQTVSNWETDKTYPDVESLLLLSSLFDVSVDDLVRGDVEMLQENARANAKKLNFWGGLSLASAALALLVLTGGPFLFGIPGTFFVTLVPIFVCAVAAYRASRIMKSIDVATTAEMVAFLEGRPVNRDEAKRKQYRKCVAIITIIVTVVSGCIGAFIGLMAYKAGF